MDYHIHLKTVPFICIYLVMIPVLLFRHRHRHVGILRDDGWGRRIFPGATMKGSLDPPQSWNAPVAFPGPLYYFSLKYYKR